MLDSAFGRLGSTGDRRLSVWPKPLLRAGLKHRIPTHAFPLGESSCRVFARGRHALAAGFAALGLHPGDGVLMPAYHHGSEVEAALTTGLEVAYYDITEGCEPDESSIRHAMHRGVRALLLIHYLGFPQDAPRWRTVCDELGILLIEDAAPAWLASVGNRPVGAYGDLAVFCLYKSIGVPDGAAALGAWDLPDPPAAVGSTRVALRRYAVSSSSALPGISRVVAQRRLARSYDPRADFAMTPGTGPSQPTRFLLARYDAGTVAARRRAHFETLRGALTRDVASPFAKLDSGASPMCFPVSSARKDEALGRLAELGIDALDFWSHPHPSLDAACSPFAAELRRRVIGLPVHQDLTDGDLDRIVAAMESL